MGLRLQLYATIHMGGYGSRRSPGRLELRRVGKGAVCRDTAGGHASLCPPYEFVALLLAMTTSYASASSRRNRARVVVRNTLEKKEGAGNAGRPMRPIAACAMIVVERTRVSQVTPESPGTPRAMVYGLY